LETASLLQGSSPAEKANTKKQKVASKNLQKKLCQFKNKKELNLIKKWSTKHYQIQKMKKKLRRRIIDNLLSAPLTTILPLEKHGFLNASLRG